MSENLRILRTEILKLKRTLALWIAILAPALIAGMGLLIMWADGEDMMRMAEGQPWLWYTKFLLTIWGIFFLPLFASLETALLAGLEHQNQGWKQIFVQPAGRGRQIAAKQVVSLALIGISHAELWGLALADGYLLRLLHPGLGFNSPAPWGMMFLYVLAAYLMAWLLIALHGWVALRFHSFVVALGFGVAATLSGAFLVSSPYARYYPWAMVGLAANNFTREGIPGAQVLVAAVLGLVIFLVGNLDIRRREMV